MASPTTDLPLPIIPMRYMLHPCRRGERSLAGSTLRCVAASSDDEGEGETRSRSGFLYGFSTPGSAMSDVGSSHSNPPADRAEVRWYDDERRAVLVDLDDDDDDDDPGRR